MSDIKKKTTVFMVALVAMMGGLLFFSDTTLSAPDAELTYHGKLTDTSNVAVPDGTYDFTLVIYDAPTGGNCLWSAQGNCTTPTAKTLTITNGIFSTTLGESGDNPLNLDFSQNYYLGVTIGTNSEMTPRRKITPTGFALNSHRLNGLTADNYIDTSTTAQTKAGSLTVNDDFTVNTNDLFVDTSTGRVGVGTDSPGQILHTYESAGLLRLLGETGDASTADYQFRNSGGSAYFGLTSGGSAYIDARGAAGDIQFRTNGGTTYMTLDPVGKVGIGTSSPADKLEIQNGFLRIDGAGTSDSLIKFADGSGVKWTIGSDDSGHASGSDAFVFASDDGIGTNERMIISSVGNVGIGTSSPSEKFHLDDGTLLINNPTTVNESGAVTGISAVDVHVSGQYAYVASTSQGLSILDISSPTSPALIGTYNTSGSAWAVHVAGSYAYVADHSAGLQIIDVSDPTSPSLVGSYDTNGTAYGIFVSGQYAYVGDGPYGLKIIDISDPTNPTLTGSYDNGLNESWHVYVSGQYAYVPDRTSNTIHIVDISDPSSPSFVSSYAATSLDVQVIGRYMYVAARGGGLHIVDVSDPATPTLVGSYDTSGDAWGVHVAGQYAYIADFSAGMHIIDISNPASPSLSGTYNTSGLAYGIYTSGKYAYIADNGALRIIDVKGANIYALRAGNIGTGSITVAENADIGNHLFVRSGLNVGSRGIFSDGSISTADNGYFGGNVGIGTSAPTARLQIGTTTASGTLSEAYISLGGAYSATDGSPKLKMWDDGTNWFGFGVSSSQLDYVTQLGSDHVFYGNGNEILRIDGASGKMTSSSPSTSLLNTVGSTTQTTYSGIELVSDTGALVIFKNGSTYSSYGGTGSANFYNTQNTPITFYQNTNERMRIDTGGNVGIGTPSPTQKLTVSGSAWVTDSLGVGTNVSSTYQLSVDAIKTGVSGTTDYQRGIYASVRPNPSLWTQTNHNASGIVSGVTTDASLTATDTVTTLIGIQTQYGAYTGTAGTITSAYGLHITPYQRAGTIVNQTDLYLAEPSTGTGTITGTHYSIYQAAASATNYFSGNVGIGTGAPSDKLELYSSGAASYGMTMQHNSSALGSNYFPRIALEQVPSGQSYTNSVFLKQTNASQGNYPSFTISTQAGYGDTTEYDRFFISGYNGDIGIGTTSPTARLQIGNTTSSATLSDTYLSLGGQYSATAGTNPKIKIFDAGGTDWIGLGVSGGQLDYMVRSTDDHVFYTGSNERMRIDGTSGYVGIGLSNPNYPLHLYGTTNGGADVYSQTDGGRSIKHWFRNAGRSWSIGQIGTTSSPSYAFNITDETAAETRLAIDISGNVGIGTTSPQSALHLSGSTAAASTLRLTSTATGGNTWAMYSGTNALHAVPDGSLGFWDSGSFATRMLIDTNGNVGIGTISPDYKLQIAGDIVPETDDTYDLGTTALRWKDLYLSSSSLHIGDDAANEVVLSYNATNDTIAFSKPTTIVGSVQLTNDADSCSAAKEGTMRYNSTSKAMEFCNGTTWGGLGGGASLPTCINGQTLSYNETSSQWECTDAATGGSSTEQSTLLESSWVAASTVLPTDLNESQTAVIGDYVYLFGGTSSTATGDIIYRAPVTDPTAWTDTGSTLPGALYGAQTMVIGDHVYLFGGRSSAFAVSSAIYRAPVTDPTAWTDTGSTLPGGISESQAAIIGDYVYLFGGKGSFSASSVIYRAPLTDPTAWTNTGSTLPGSLYASQVAVIGDYVYLFGGYSSAATDTIYRAPVTDPTAWTDTGYTLPGELSGSSLAIIGDNVYLFGGAVGSTATVLNVVYRASVYNPTTWTDLGSILPGTNDFSQTAIIGDNVYLFGGRSALSTGTDVIYFAEIQNGYPDVTPNLAWKVRENVVGSGGTSSLPTCTDGQILSYNGTSSAWECADAIGGGDSVDVETHSVGSLASQSINSTTYIDITESVKTVDLKEGTLSINWNISGFSTLTNTNYAIQVCVDAVCGGETEFWHGQASIHKGWSGVWTTPVTAGSHDIKLQLKRISGSGAFNVDNNDSVSWLAIVNQDGTGASSSLPTCTDGQTLTYNETSSQWECADPSGGGGWTSVNQQVYTGNGLTSWTDLDLSSYVGSQSALVKLKVKNNSTSLVSDYDFRTNGDTDEMSGSTVAGGSNTARNGVELAAYIILATDENGIIEWLASAATPTDIDLIGYIGASSGVAGSGQTWSLMHVQDQKTTGTNAGSCVAGDNTRDLNTVLTNDISGASLSSNQVTLPAGKYYIEGWASEYRSGKAMLRLTDGSTNYLFSRSGSARETTTSYPFQGELPIAGEINLSSTTTLSLVQNVSTTYSSDVAFGAAANIGPHEIYSDLRIWKIESAAASSSLWAELGGNVYRETGNVGIGTTSPTNKISIVSEDISGYILNTTYRNSVGSTGMVTQKARGTASSPLAVQNGDDIGGVYFRGYDGDEFIEIASIQAAVDGVVSNNTLPTALIFSTGSTTRTERMRISSGGNIGIGTPAPASKLSVGGNGSASIATYLVGPGTGSSTYGVVVRNAAESVNNFFIRDDGAGYLRAASWTYGSDRRLKENITDIDYGLSEILSLTPQRFDYIDGSKDQIGFIAQDIQSIIPEAVSIQEDGMLGLQTDFFIPVLVNAVKEQNTLITENSNNLTTKATATSLSQLQKLVDTELANIDTLITTNQQEILTLQEDANIQADLITNIQEEIDLIDQEQSSLASLVSAHSDTIIAINENILFTTDPDTEETTITMSGITIVDILKADAIETNKIAIDDSVTEEDENGDEVSAASVGTETVVAGETEVEIVSRAISETSRVFVTARNENALDVNLTVTEVADGSCRVGLPTALEEDLTFDWFVVAGE